MFYSIYFLCFDPTGRGERMHYCYWGDFEFDMSIRDIPEPEILLKYVTELLNKYVKKVRFRSCADVDSNMRMLKTTHTN